MELKVKMNNDLIFCEKCFVVVNKQHCSLHREQDSTGHFYSRKELDELLAERPFMMLHKYSDLEQETSEYLKYCPVCQRVTRFSIVKFEVEE